MMWGNSDVHMMVPFNQAPLRLMGLVEMTERVGSNERGMKTIIVSPS